MNERSIERVLYAASCVDVADAREAAILGGVVRSLLNDGKLSMQFIRYAARIVRIQLTWRSDAWLRCSVRSTTRVKRRLPNDRM